MPGGSACGLRRQAECRNYIPCSASYTWLRLRVLIEYCLSIRRAVNSGRTAPMASPEASPGLTATSLSEFIPFPRCMSNSFSSPPSLCVHTSSYKDISQFRLSSKNGCILSESHLLRPRLQEFHILAYLNA